MGDNGRSQDTLFQPSFRSFTQNLSTFISAVKTFDMDYEMDYDSSHKTGLDATDGDCKDKFSFKYFGFKTKCKNNQLSRVCSQKFPFFLPLHNY